ncbi:unnamed protein product [Rhizoctonia solani]|uniref:Nephrocystin 3-like N-terminal domain-containing protein n=1 Tax=Rhizoctonia solani TaxID=456999 RepID=A0A8H3BSN9_9AGAM|nr:unnamed protein product [Rhizoctonia solani]
MSDTDSPNSQPEGASKIGTQPEDPTPLTGNRHSHRDRLKRWTHLTAFRKLLEHGANSLGPLKATVTDVADCIGIVDDVLSGKKEYEILKDELEKTFEMLTQHYGADAPPTITACVETLCKDINKELQQVKDKLRRGRADRFREASNDLNNVLRCYNRVRDLLQRVSTNADVSTWRIVNAITTNNFLKDLKPAMSACYNSSQAFKLKRGPCTKGTRIDVLSRIVRWISAPDSEPVYWMNGMAGTGKTTIAYTLCEELDADGWLAASFFCSRLLPECRDVDLIIPSIAYQLARSSRPFQSVLSRILEKDPDAHTRLSHLQFDDLIVRPLSEVKHTLPQNLIVVIDALDECEDKESTSRILSVLLAKSRGLPVRFVIGSRPEPEIWSQMSKQNNQAKSRVALHDLDKQMVQNDIEAYLRDSLMPMETTETDIAKLVERAGILFIYAATVVRYISYNNFQNSSTRLANILSTSGIGKRHEEIDELYTMILRDSLDNPKLEDVEKEEIRQALHTVICAKEPLTVHTLSGLLGVDDPSRVYAALRPLWSVLYVSGTSQLITTLHTSFPDYMLDPSRSRQYHCDPLAQNQVLTLRCFACFRSNRPQFNICGLKSSFVLDDQVMGLEERVKRAITAKLFYSARYWAGHLHSAIRSPSLVQELEEFLSSQLLLWMEVMVLKKCADNMPVVIRLAEEWATVNGCSKYLKATIHDARRFTIVFTSSSMSKSTPHIYISMLSFWPKTLPIAKFYGKRTRRMIKVKGPAISQQQQRLLAIWHFNCMSWCTSFSPDGLQIAIGQFSEVWLLSASTGQKLLPPFKGHSGLIRSLQFSPNGARIVSGSDDKTICVWDTQSGEMVLGPLRSHTDFLSSVTFSPDGFYIASGSKDKTICTWNAYTGQRILGPLIGDDGEVKAVKYSPNGRYIVSLSASVLHVVLWDCKDGQILKRLHGRQYDYGGFHWVDISPDSTRIAAGSSSYIYVWDIESGEVVLDWLLHLSSYAPDPFPADGSWLVVSYNNMMVCVWDAQSGNLVAGPLEVHAHSTESISFSPDHSYIISTSYDNTLRLWSTRSTQATSGPLLGHTSSIKSINVSPDGTRVVSVSSTSEVYIWNAESGELVVDIPEKRLRRWKWPLNWMADTSVQSAIFTTDGSYVIVNTDQGPSIINAKTGALYSQFAIIGIVQLKVGSFDAFNTFTSQVIPITLIGVYFFHHAVFRMTEIPIHWPCISWAEPSPDGAWVISGSTDGTIQVNDVHTNNLTLSFSPPTADEDNRTLSFVSFSSDGRRIFSKSGDRKLQMHCANSGTLLVDLNDDEWNDAIGFSPDGARVLIKNRSRTITLLDLATREGLELNGNCLEGGRPSHLLCYYMQCLFAFTADGSYIAFAMSDHSLCIWSARNGELLLGPIKGHTTSVLSIAFSPDGEFMVSGGDDGIMCITDVRSATLAPRPLDSSLPAVEWEMNEDGWIVDDQSRLLACIPSELRHALMRPRTKRMISRTGWLQLDFTDACIGESWAECYRAE